jgi:hypothetical protein
LEIVAVDGGEVRARGEVGDTAEHDERVTGAPAQRLRAGEEEHSGRVVRLPLLHGPPSEVMEELEVAPRGGRLGLRATVGDVSASGGGSLEQEDENENHV